MTGMSKTISQNDKIVNLFLDDICRTCPVCGKLVFTVVDLKKKYFFGSKNLLLHYGEARYLIHHAILFRRLDVLNILLEHGADPDVLLWDHVSIYQLCDSDKKFRIEVMKMVDFHTLI